MSATQYPLGTNTLELERLRFQHEVWGGVTRAFLARLGVGPGMRVLDLGCGPGFVTADIAELVGPKGSVVALDESALWIEHLEGEIARRGWKHVRAVRARLQDAPLDANAFDVIFARWVFSFVPEPAPVVATLARALKPGGAFAIEDYNHEGISLFPESDGFRAVVRATRALYASMGGDTWVAGRASGIFRRAGLELETLTPNVLCGGPGSPVFRWAALFFPHFSQVMVAKGLLTAAEREKFLAEWTAHEQDRDALFFSPIVVDCVARKPR